MFEQRLADAEEAVYGQRRRRDGAERAARDSWRRSENESRERWRRREGGRPERDHMRRGNERDSSPVHDERYYGRGRKEEREQQGKEGMFRDKDKGRERDRGRETDIESSRKKERSTDREKETERQSAFSALESFQSSSVESHSNHFVERSEDDSGGEAIWNVIH